MKRVHGDGAAFQTWIEGVEVEGGYDHDACGFWPVASETETGSS